MTKPVQHIVHLLYRFDTGGLENGVVNLINRLSADQYRHSIVTLAGSSNAFKQRLVTDNVEFYDLDKQPGQDWGSFLRFNRLLKRLSPDILHSRNLGVLEYQLIGWWRRIGLRIHGEHGWDVQDLNGSNVRYQRIRRVIKPFVHQFIALSAESRDYLRDKIHVPSHRIQHICNGVDIDKFAPDAPKPDNLPEHFLSADTLVFGTVGRLAKVKNQPFLLDAFILLCRQYPQQAADFRLLIVGDGELKAQLQQRIEQAGVGQQVFLAGTRSDIDNQLHAMDVFVLPSLAEGISNTLLEAMASGLPVIATHVGGNPELLPPAWQTTHLVSVGDVEQLAAAMGRYVDEPGQLDKDKQIARHHCVENFSIDTMVNKYQQVYQLAM